jgi:tartrate-resistant acid phosphatase type 5
MNRRNLFLLIIFVLGIGAGVAARLLPFSPYYTPRESSTPSSLPVPFSPPEVTYILTGDTGSGLPAQQKVADAIENYCQMAANCQAVFVAGDVIYEEGVKSINDPQFQTKFEEPYAEINLPFYIAFGNHDYAGCTQCYLDYAAKSQKWKMPDYYYMLSNFPDVDFFIIDTEKFDVAQRKWLQRELEKSSKTWKIAVGHRPIESFEVSKYKEDWTGKSQFLEDICQAADFYVAGHAHILEDRGELGGCTVKQLVSGGGGASSRTVVDNHQDQFVHESYGFLAVKVKGNELHYQFIDDNGNVLFEQFLKK